MTFAKVLESQEFMTAPLRESRHFKLCQSQVKERGVAQLAPTAAIMRFSRSICAAGTENGAKPPLLQNAGRRFAQDSVRCLCRAMAISRAARAKMPHGLDCSFLAEGNRVWFEPKLNVPGDSLSGIVPVACGLSRGKR
ncbi:hypothetical protein [Mesorhizobium sp. A556]